MRVALAALIGLLSLVAVSAAGAAQRYAAPEGKGGEPCAQTAPCSLKDALNGAKSEDEVIVTAGSYAVSAPILVPTAKNLYVHGDLSGPMPKINGTVAGPPIVFVEGGQHVAYLELIDISGEGAYGFACGAGWRIERVRVLAVAAKYAIGIFQNEDCLIRDSVLTAQGLNAVGLQSAGGAGGVGVARNLTVLASGTESTAVLAINSGAHALDLKNTILAGGALDLKAGIASKVLVGNSNFDSSKGESESTILDLGGNQTAAPLFVDAAKADYREAGGSPTIDAGVDDQLAALDLAGSARVIGPAVDIGAFEFVPPAPGQVQSVAVKPKAFRTGKVPSAIVSRGKKAAPAGATVGYSLSAGATISFTVERKSVGRRAGKRCVKKTHVNAGHKQCPLYRPAKGGFSDSGAAGQNSFKFSGRIGGKALKPGSYRLLGSAGGVSKSAAFTILR